MIPLLEAQRILSRPVTPPGPAELVPIEHAVGRVLAESLTSDQDLPPFDRVTMDGYAVRAQDLQDADRLRVIGEVPAGAVASRPLAPGEAWRVMTGAPLPPGSDAVVMVEQTTEEGGEVQFQERPIAGQNIHRRGQDLALGTTPLEPGARLTTAHVPLLATLGRREVAVRRRPRVHILTSGDELVEPCERPGPGQIRDSNRLGLAAQVISAGGEVTCHPVVPDAREALEAAVADALREADVLLLTGGSSVGRYDFSHEAVAATGARLWFHKVAIKPGKPVLYFTLGPRRIFCLPGNPVSAFVTFELMVRPALERDLGLDEVWPVPLTLNTRQAISAPAARDLYRVSTLVADQMGTGWEVEPVNWSGSGDLVSVSRANALLKVLAGAAHRKGEPVSVLPLRHCGEGFPRRSEPLA